MDLNLGSRLQEIRKRHKLSQRELARRAGMHNGTISLIESNKTSPSVESLKKLLDCLSVSLADFFAVEQDGRSPYFFGQDDMVKLQVGKITYKQLGSDVRGQKVQLIYVQYEPGADSGDVTLHDDVEEVGFVLKGQIDVTIDGHTSRLGPGEGYLFPSERAGRFRNTSDAPCEYIVVSTPPGF